jgi:hypothetical protein
MILPHIGRYGGHFGKYNLVQGIFDALLIQLGSRDF